MPFLAGTDAPAGFDLVPGASLHSELEWLVRAGFTPLEALQTATRNPATCLGRTRGFGTVEPGKIADLVGVILRRVVQTDMHHHLTTTGILLGLALASSSARAADPTAEIAAFNKAYDAAVLSMDNARVLTFWAPDGLSLLPGEKPVRGREALAGFLAQVQASTPGWKVIAQESTCHDIIVHGDWASEWCETHQVASRPGGQPNWEGWGKMALVLEKQHGRWVIRQEMWNQGVAPSR